MQTQQTFNGRNNHPQSTLHFIELIVNNDSDSVKKVLLTPSTARLFNDSYKAKLLKDSDNCAVQTNPHFNSLAELNAFVFGCPTRLHTVTIQPIASTNLLEQTTEAVKILTPTFNEDIVEGIAPSPVAGGSAFLLPDFFLGGAAEVEITVQPSTKIKITLQFGVYHTTRLVAE